MVRVEAVLLVEQAILVEFGKVLNQARTDASTVLRMYEGSKVKLSMRDKKFRGSNFLCILSRIGSGLFQAQLASSAEKDTVQLLLNCRNGVLTRGCWKPMQSNIQKRTNKTFFI